MKSLQNLINEELSLIVRVPGVNNTVALFQRFFYIFKPMQSIKIRLRLTDIRIPYLSRLLLPVSEKNRELLKSPLCPKLWVVVLRRFQFKQVASRCEDLIGAGRH